jgi:iron complex transport system ATP-binding protein
VTHTDVLADRLVDELSGGQRQRVWVAMALAQATPILLLDEPTTYLDIAHQLEVLDLLQRLNHDDGTTIVMVLHDLNEAARYSDTLVAMSKGRIVACGPPAEVVTEDNVRAVFGIDSRVVPDPVTGTPMVVPIGARTRGATPNAAKPTANGQDPHAIGSAPHTTALHSGVA